MERLGNLAVVCAGSALGGGARYLVSLAAAARGWTAFPWATLIVNVAGSFLIMLIATIAAATTMSAQLRLFLTTGIMGGLTTYSTFNYETTNFVQTGAPLSALLNVGSTLAACFAAGLLGVAVARIFVGP
jgi:CrcB protein